MATIRQQMIELLGNAECDARQISRELGIGEKEVYAHLPHVARSVSKQGKKLETVPARCIACGYAFAARQRMTRPGRCPACKSERIAQPRFRVT